MINMTWEDIIKERRRISSLHGSKDGWWRGYAEDKFWGDERVLPNYFVGAYRWIDKLSDEEKQDEGIQEDIAYIVKLAEKYAPIFNEILTKYG